MSTIQLARIPATEHIGGDMPMFDLPQIVANDDTARARRTDDDSSHAGADKSAATIRIIRDTLYSIYVEHPFGLTDEEVVRKFWLTPGIPTCHIDSPRKRISDLENAGLIAKTGTKRRSLSGVNVNVRAAVTL